jgi:hypothetical protein
MKQPIIYILIGYYVKKNSSTVAILKYHSIQKYDDFVIDHPMTSCTVWVQKFVVYN